MPRQPVDLAAHINCTIERGHPAEFPVSLRPVFYAKEGSFEPAPQRMAVVREDTGATLSVVSDRYTLVRHERILELVEQALAPLDVAPVPRGVFVDRNGARMRALFKFPALARPVTQGDDICPCLKIQNTYDGTSRIAIHIGAFRFVCTNLAVGGGGIFAGGFMSVHAGEIPIEEVAGQLANYLAGLEAIISLYRFWAETRFEADSVATILEPMPKRASEAIGQAISTDRPVTVYAAYNVATWLATHQMRSYRMPWRASRSTSLSRTSTSSSSPRSIRRRSRNWRRAGSLRTPTTFCCSARPESARRIWRWGRPEGLRPGLPNGVHTAAGLIATLTRALSENRLEEKLKQLVQPKLLIVDEIGYLPIDRLGANLFFQLVSRRYEKGSILITSNQSLTVWGEVFGDRVIATAILDRLLHHSTIVNIKGESYRLKEKRKAGLLTRSEPFTETPPGTQEAEAPPC